MCVLGLERREETAALLSLTALKSIMVLVLHVHNIVLKGVGSKDVQSFTNGGWWSKG